MAIIEVIKRGLSCVEGKDVIMCTLCAQGAARWTLTSSWS